MSYKSLKIDEKHHINQDSDLRVRINVNKIKKTYKIYDKPENRLKEMFLGKINNILYRKSQKDFTRNLPHSIIYPSEYMRGKA